MIVLLDASTLGLIPNPTRTPAAEAANLRVDELLAAAVWVLVPEIADYEVRRELIRSNRSASMSRLEWFATRVGYVALNTDTMRRAAELWAETRRRGRPTAGGSRLDADVILAAQAQLLAEATGDMVVVATDNVRHLGLFVDARPWRSRRRSQPKRGASSRSRANRYNWTDAPRIEMRR